MSFFSFNIRKRFQVILVLSMFVILVVGFTGFTAISHRYIFDQLVHQVINDNRVIGQEILNLLTGARFDPGREKDLIAALQNICDEIKLPNGGFLCAANTKGDIVALPGLQEGQQLNISRTVLSDIKAGKRMFFEDLTPQAEFTGIFEVPDPGGGKQNQHADIIAVLPVKRTGLRLLVHQKREPVKQRAEQTVKPLFLLGIGFILALCVLTFMVVNRVVLRYEHRLERLNKDLTRLNRELTSVSTVRKQLLHVLSHDLSNPLISIPNFVDRMESQPESAGKYKDLICMSANQCLGILDIIEQIQALEERKMTLNIQPANLKKIIDTSYKVLETKFFSKELHLKIDVPKDIEVLAEKSSLSSSVLNNLFTNAIKFSEKRSTIEVSACRENGRVKLTVADSGIGMPAHIKDNIFNPDSKNVREGTAGETGIGFGMPLVKRFVEAYCGSISIESKERSENSSEHGTTVTVFLHPAQPAARKNYKSKSGKHQIISPRLRGR